MRNPLASRLQASDVAAYSFDMTLIYHTPLSAAQQAVAGIDPVQPLAMADRVRSVEVDIQNHVNNAVYMNWFERLRIQYMQDRVMPNIAEQGVSPRFVLRSGTIHYRREMRMDEDYITTCACTAFRNSSFTLAQQVWSGGTLRTTFEGVMVLLTPDGAAKMPIPEATRAGLIASDGAIQER